MNSGLKASPKALPGSFPGRLDEAWQNDVARRAGQALWSEPLPHGASALT